MSLESELEPKLEELRRRADERFNYYLYVHGYRMDYEGVVYRNSDPGDPMPAHDPGDVERSRYQREWRDFSQLLYELDKKFRSFYALDQRGLDKVMHELGEFYPPAGTNAIREVHDACFEWMLPVNAMLGVWRDPTDSPSDNGDSQQWDGPSAEAFLTTLLEPYFRTFQWQTYGLLALRMTVRIYAAVCQYAANSITTIADNCIAALRGQVAPDDAETSLILGGVGAGASVAAFFPPLAIPAGVVSVATGAVSFGLGLKDYFKGEKDTHGPDLTVENGDIPVDILGSCMDVIGRLEQSIQDTEQKLSAALDQDLGSASFSSPHMWLHRTEEFEHQHLTVSDRASSMVAPIVNLYEVGYKYLPGAAFQYNDAFLNLGGATLPGGFGGFFPRSAPKYEDARSLLAHYFAVTRDNLRECGETLTQVARDYELAEEDNASLLRQISKIEAPTLEDHESPAEPATTGPGPV